MVVVLEGSAMDASSLFTCSIQGSGNVAEEWAERIQELIDGGESCEIPSSGHATASSHITSERRWLSAQNSHKIQSVRMPTRMEEGPLRLHPWWKSKWLLMEEESFCFRDVGAGRLFMCQWAVHTHVRMISFSWTQGLLIITTTRRI